MFKCQIWLLEDPYYLFEYSEEDDIREALNEVLNDACPPNKSLFRIFVSRPSRKRFYNLI